MEPQLYRVYKEGSSGLSNIAIWKDSVEQLQYKVHMELLISKLVPEKQIQYSGTATSRGSVRPTIVLVKSLLTGRSAYGCWRYSGSNR